MWVDIRRLPGVEVLTVLTLASFIFWLSLSTRDGHETHELNARHIGSAINNSNETQMQLANHLNGNFRSVVEDKRKPKPIKMDLSDIWRRVEMSHYSRVRQRRINRTAFRTFKKGGKVSLTNSLQQGSRNTDMKISPKKINSN
ncbi:uncharacterized protein LOC142346088 [Convolutriloba macropyga]|uniref:uncharacterized protein LOC142346088 n=1 Tax=Convolutriloba macropyga TaxID=536237 RepID=UPI003F51C6A3